MNIKDIIPKHLVLGENIDDFSLATTKVDYSIEDLCCYVTNNVDCYYWLNIESIWGPLGFQWNIINNYGTFKSTNLEFNTLPSLPDGERFKSFNNTFDNLNRDIEVYKSNWINISSIYLNFFENYIFIFNGDVSIPKININYNSKPTSNIRKYQGVILNFNLNNTDIILNNHAALIIKNDSNKYFPFKSINNNVLKLNIIEDIYIPIYFYNSNDVTYILNFYNNIIEIHLYILYSIKDYVYYLNDYNKNNIDLSNTILYLHGCEYNKEQEGTFSFSSFNFNNPFKDIVFTDIDNIKDKSLDGLYISWTIKKHYWYEIDRRLYDKVINNYRYIIYFDINEITPCPFIFNLSCNLSIYLTKECLNNHKESYRVQTPFDYINYYYFNYDLFPNYEFYKDFIGIINLHTYYNTSIANLDDTGIKLFINDESIITQNQLFLLNDNVKKVYGIKNSYYHMDDNKVINPIDIRKKEYIVLKEDFNKITSNSNNYYNSKALLIGTLNENDNFTQFEIDEVRPFDIINYNSDNIKKYTIDYTGLYTIKDFNVTQPLVISKVCELYADRGLIYYLQEELFSQLNNCEIKYIYKTKLIVNKDSVLTENKFLEIINAYIFDNDITSAKGITIELYTDYFKLIPEDKYIQFLNDGYVIIEKLQ